MEAMGYLEAFSALEMPPALAAFRGIGSVLFGLSTSVAFDKLHVIEHRILRRIPDRAYKMFESAVQYNGWSKKTSSKLQTKAF